MKCKFIFAAIAVTAFAACSKQIDEKVELTEGPVSLEIAVAGDATKATANTGDDQVKTLQVFVFGEGHRLEAYKSDTGVKSLKLGVFSGSKIIHALVNAPAITGIFDYEDFYKTVSKLTDNSIGNFVMEGWKNVTVGNTGLSETINVKRIAAKISLMKIENQLEGVYGASKLELSRVYLINVAADRTYSSFGNTCPVAEIWLNKQGFVEADGVKDLTCDVMTEVELSKSEPYVVKHSFYCYPNQVVRDNSDPEWSIRKTRLVIEVKIDGKLYYYPITINAHSQNTEYKVSLKITRPGSLNPDIPYNPESASVSVKVQDWDQGTAVDETI